MFMNPNLIHGYCSYFTTSLPSYIDFCFAKPLFWNIICTGAAQPLAAICRIAANGTAYTIYNGFLAQQSKETGMPTYFLPMTTGSKKKWASKRNDFWCCQGTMIQSATKYPEMIYSADDEDRILYVNQYIPSELTGGLGNTSLRI